MAPVTNTTWRVARSLVSAVAARATTNHAATDRMPAAGSSRRSSRPFCRRRNPNRNRTESTMTNPASTSGGGAGAGLRDVVAAPSSICFIDGEQGILSYRGYNIHDLAQHSTFEEVVFLLWSGRLPKRGEFDELNARLVANRALPAEIVSMLKSFPRSAVPMDALRTAVSALAFYDPERG